MISDQLHALLRRVQKPAQYLGNETNAVHKDFNSCSVRVALIFPDAYEMGMSHMGLKILYEILTSMEGVVAERCFAPLQDMEAELRLENLPLFSLESKTPLNEFDVIGISLPYELTYTNVLNILDMAHIPLFQKDRRDHHPIILAGGTQSYNPEPMADFLDAVAIGDGEELIADVVHHVKQWKNTHGIDRISRNQKIGTREELLASLTQVEGLYVPKFFEPRYGANGTLAEIKPLKPGYERVSKRIVKDLDSQPYPTKLVVPNIRLIHDRIGIEIQRGCTRMCRFCQAGYIERPTRQRSPEKVLQIADDSLKQTGIDEISLLSLSAGDYQTIVPTLKEMNRRYAHQKVSISVPATRTETLTPEMIEQVKKVRMTGFTIAPEAGSARMRRVINKGNKVDDLLQASRNAFSAGYRLIKFYYMCGLPFETDEDVTGIAHEAREALQTGWEYARNIKINVSVSSFVPKPFTPFQWEPQMTLAETRRKHHLVKSHLRDKALVFKCHTPEMSYLEGLFARGDRRLSKVICRAFQNGCRFDEWSEHFDFSKWQTAFEQTGVDLDFYLHRRRDKDEVLPWDHLFAQMKKSWLWEEYKNAEKEAFVADCSVDKCAKFCGVCDFKTVKNRIYVIDERPLAVKKGNREAYGRFDHQGRGEKSFAPAIPTTNDQRLTTNDQYKLRVRYAKIGLAALYGHLELMNILKRSLLRNRFPVDYSSGYHPQLKISMGPALALGVESEHESFDLTLTKRMHIADFIEKINKTLPVGLHVLGAEFVDLNAPSIYSMIRAVQYQIQFSDAVPDDKAKKFNENLAALGKGKVFSLTKLRHKGREKTKTVLINQFLKNHLTLSGGKSFNINLLCDERGSLKPTDVVTALSPVTRNELAKLRVKKIGVFLHP